MARSRPSPVCFFSSRRRRGKQPLLTGGDVGGGLIAQSRNQEGAHGNAGCVAHRAPTTRQRPRARRPGRWKCVGTAWAFPLSTGTSTIELSAMKPAIRRVGMCCGRTRGNHEGAIRGAETRAPDPPEPKKNKKQTQKTAAQQSNKESSNPPKHAAKKCIYKNRSKQGKIDEQQSTTQQAPNQQTHETHVRDTRR